MGRRAKHRKPWTLRNRVRDRRYRPDCWGQHHPEFVAYPGWAEDRVRYLWESAPILARMGIG